MKRKIAILLTLSLVVSALGAHAVANQSPSTAETTAQSPHASVPSATQPSDEHVGQASERAQNLVDGAPAQAAAEESRTQHKFVTKVTKLQQSAKRSEAAWDQLVVKRSIALNARGATAYQEAKQGDLTEQEIRKEVERLRNEIDSFEKRTSYRASSPTRAVVLVGEIEASLTSAEGWLEQSTSVLERDDLSKDERLAYAASALEGARGNLNDAQLLHKKYRTELRSGADQETALEERYAAIHESVQSEIDAASYSEDVYANEMVEKADHYLQRAEERYESGYKAAALRDALRAELFLNAADATADVKAPTSEVEPAAMEDVQAAKADAVTSLNATLDSTDDGVVLLLLQHSERQIVGGNQDVEWVAEHPDDEAQQTAYARYVVAETLADAAPDVADQLEE